MKFRTKKALLEYLGKKWNDNKLVDRMILRWEVVREDRMYVLIDKDSEIIHLKSLVSEKEKEIKNLNETISELNTTISDLEYQLSNTDKGGDRALAEKIYKFLVYQYWANIDKSEFMEAIWF